MAFKSEELVLALMTENGELIAARSCGGTQHQCDALAFDKIIDGSKEDLKILKDLLEKTLAVIKSKERELEGRNT